MDVTRRRVPDEDVRSETRPAARPRHRRARRFRQTRCCPGSPRPSRLVEGDAPRLETGVLISVVDGVVDQFAAGTVTAAAGGALPGSRTRTLAALAQQAAAGPALLTLTEGRGLRRAAQLRGSLVAGQAGPVPAVHRRLRCARPAGRAGAGHPGPAALDADAPAGRRRGQGPAPASSSASSPPPSCSPPAPPVRRRLRLPARGGRPDPERRDGGHRLTFVIARVARTAEQANIAQSILAMVLGIAGGAFFPVRATGFAATLLDLNPIAAFIRGLGITAGRRRPRRTSGTGRGHARRSPRSALVLSRLVPDRGARHEAPWSRSPPSSCGASCGTARTSSSSSSSRCCSCCCSARSSVRQRPAPGRDRRTRRTLAQALTAELESCRTSTSRSAARTTARADLARGRADVGVFLDDSDA